MIALFIALQVADIALTVLALKRGAQEANPIARLFISRLGAVAGLIVLKLIGASIVIGVALMMPDTARLIFLALACLLYTAVVVNNAIVARLF